MKKIYVKGYINLDDEEYTFNYEDKRLTLISVENKQSFFQNTNMLNFLKDLR